MHYHVIPAGNTNVAIASIRYDNYEDSVEAWVKMSTGMFGHLKEQMGSMEIEKAKRATDNGEGEMARVGTNSLCFYWTRCDRNCYSVTWN